MQPHWLPYFEVTDCDAAAATAAEQGGTVPIPPSSVEGVGRWALLTDPFGATFAVITSEPA
jgi:predicted enzyme related to lactoylglutathione lyase